MSLAEISPIIGSFAASGERTQAGERRRELPASAAAAPTGNSTSQVREPSQLRNEALAQLAKLKARDMQVRQHEAAHLAAAGGLVTSGASYTYQKGPDGVNYAIGGEVGIDVSPGRTPQETIDRARIIRAASLAPVDPSGPDLAVAARAQQMELKARSELAQQPSQSLATAPQPSAQLQRAYSASNTSSRRLSVFA